MKFPKTKIISFRKEIKDITNTGYLTHSLYFHPAKFIPQIVRYCLIKFCKKNSNILDPFAGSGTAGLEAAMFGCNAYLLEISPIIDYFYPIKIPQFTIDELNLNYKELLEKVDNIFNNINKRDIYFQNDGLSYWYPQEIYNIFGKLWGQFHQIKEDNTKLQQSLLFMALSKISKFYSYAEHSMPKLFTSKRKREFIATFINEKTFKNSKEKIIKEKLLLELNKIFGTVRNLIAYKKIDSKIKYYGVDSYSFTYDKLPPIDCIITSPPYLQAQEYIRTFKLELMWLGYSKKDISRLTNLEIPYRKPENMLQGIYIEKMRERIKRKNLVKLFDSYFWFTIKTLERASKRLRKRGKLCVLIGNPKMEGVEVEIWKAIYEYFINSLNYKFIDVFEDIIIARKLFRGRKNMNPSGMKSEYLIILEKQ